MEEILLNPSSSSARRLEQGREATVVMQFSRRSNLTSDDMVARVDGTRVNLSSSDVATVFSQTVYQGRGYSVCKGDAKVLVSALETAQMLLDSLDVAIALGWSGIPRPQS